MKANGKILTIFTSVWLLVSAPNASAEKSGATSSRAGISTDPISLLTKMGIYLGSLEQIGFQAEVTLKQGSESGEIKKTIENVSVSIQRPNMLHAKVVADHRNREFIYRETLATLVDWDHEVFSRIQVPNTIDSMLDNLSSEYGVTWPLADFLYLAPQEILLEQVAHSAYVGQEEVGTFECHHLTFQQENVDWEIWIETGEKPLPRKMVISYKSHLNPSQFEGIIRDWITDEPFGEESFVVEGLESLIPVDFVRVSKEPEGE